MGEEQQNDVSWALKILEREGDYSASIWTRYFHHAYCTLFGVMVPIIGNLVLKRPVWAGIQGHIMLGLAGYGVGSLLKQREIDNNAERDAIMRDYIIRHPDDFPPPQRKKWGEVLDEWVPRR